MLGGDARQREPPQDGAEPSSTPPALPAEPGSAAPPAPGGGASAAAAGPGSPPGAAASSARGPAEASAAEPPARSNFPRVFPLVLQAELQGGLALCKHLRALMGTWLWASLFLNGQKLGGCGWMFPRVSVTGLSGQIFSCFPDYNNWT